MGTTVIILRSQTGHGVTGLRACSERPPGRADRWCPAPRCQNAPVTRYVIDAPTLLHLVEHELECDPAHRLVAPNLIRSQALTLLLSAVSAGEITEQVALERHERLTELKMRLLGDRVSRRTAWKLARQQGWGTTFDAEYIAVCTLQADALISIDPAMVARAEPFVPIAPLSDLVTA